jgi:class 3 adenylate cyclase/tetratricopeptide (TPR) repeat protein
MRYTFGDYVLDTQRAELHCAGGAIKLRRKVLQVLAYLVAHHDRVVPKQELLEQVWPEQFVGDEALKSCIKTLRQALGEQGRTSRFVHTLHGQGYRFMAPVAIQAPRPAEAAPPTLAPLPPLPAGEQAFRETPAPLASALQGEHKQVTVLCGALAEASALAAHLGPETMYHLMHEVLTLAQEAVQHYGGTLLQVLGEGFVALFGAPVAHEDHARRAVVAACELRQRLRTPDALREQPQGVALRLGLHTGPVVVGPLGEPQRLYTAGGDTLARATQLQQQAALDTVLCSAATYELVQAEVQGEAWTAGSRDAASPSVAGYVVHSLLRRRAGVPQRGGRPRSPLVGRTRELALLHERLAIAARGQGQVLGIAGEPGMGKSRLLAEFAHSLAGQAVTYCEGHCLAYGGTIPYLPVRDLLRQLWSLPDPTAPDVLTVTLQQRLHAAGIVTEDGVPLLLQLLDVLGEAAGLAALSPEVRRARTFTLLRQLVLHASQHQPLVLAVENLHWSDPTSEEWLAALAAQVGGAAILLLVTYRPGYQLPWLAHSWATQVALSPLTPSDSLVVIQTVPQAAQLPGSLQQAIVAKAAGNPFFVEELTWAAVEAGNHAQTLPLPETIEAVLAARLDRLPPEAKRLVQTAAVIGPEVPVPLLQQLAGLAEDALQRGLAQLQESELLYETRLFPDPVYTFKHALTHEVAYRSLLQERRRALHAQMVGVLETLAGDQQDAQIDCLALHALRGEVWDKALTYCWQAGAKARARSAYREAVRWWEQALEALAHRPADRTTREQEIELRLDLISVLVPLGHWEQRLMHLRVAEALAVGLMDHRRLGVVYHCLAITFRNMQDYAPALDYGRRAHVMATALGDVNRQIRVNCAMSQTTFDLGDYRQTIACLQAMLPTLAGMPSHPTYLAGARPSFQAHVYLVQCCSQLGEFAAVVAYGDAARQIAEAGERPYEHVAVYSRVGGLHMYQGTLPTAIPLLERAVAGSQDGTIPVLYPGAAAALARAYALAGRGPDACAVLEPLGALESLSLPIPLHCGDALLRAGCLEEAYQLAQGALTNACHRNMRGWEAWARWLLGEVAMHGDPPDVAPAAAHYQQALALAEARGMRPLQAHCHLGLGTLYAMTGQREQAHAELSAAITLYRAMEMSFWLPQAEAVLAQAGGGTTHAVLPLAREVALPSAARQG